VREYQPRPNYVPVHQPDAVKFAKQFIGDKPLPPDGIRLDVASEVLPFLRRIELVTVLFDKPGPAARAQLSKELHQARMKINSAAGHPSVDPQHQFTINSDQRGRHRKLWIIVPLSMSVQKGPAQIAQSIVHKVKSACRHHERDRVRLQQSVQEQFGADRADEMLATINMHYKMMMRTMNGIAENVQALFDHFLRHESKIELPGIERRDH
jgi:hypothetical protein